MKANTSRKPRLRAVTSRRSRPTTFNAELPPGLPDEEMPNVRAVAVTDLNTVGRGALPGDICVVWLGHPVKSGDFGVIHAGGTFYLGTLRHGPGGYVTLEWDDGSHTFKPGEYGELGRVFSIERAGVTVKRFPL